MSRDGSGNYSLPQAAFTSGTTIESSKVNSNFSDIASALTASLAKDGQTTPTANLPMGTYKHTGVGNATARTDYAAAGQIADNSMGYAADTGTADAYAIAPAPGISAYAVGQRFTFKVTNANTTTTPTLAVNGLTAGTIKWPDGSALTAGVLPANALVEVVVSATTPVFHLQSVAVPPIRSVVVQTFTGNGTYTPTSGMIYCTIECWGAGGGGGGAVAAATGGQVATGGGGGAGGYSRKTVTAATIGTSQTVTIGTAGGGGSAGNNTGTAGGDTSVGTICVGKGGSGGGGNSGASTAVAAKGAGGVAGTGDIAAVGDDGNLGGCFTQSFGTKGGSTLVGSGGEASNGAAAIAGGAATGKGAGGGGGYSPNGTSNQAGGTGTAGYVIITEFCK